MQFPESKTIKGHKLKLMRDASTGQPVILTLRGYARFREHIEPQGYITSFVRAGKNEEGKTLYAVYLSLEAIPKEQRDLLISKCSGKMKGVLSLNVNPTLCEFCKKMRKCPGTICEYCYSYKEMSPGKSGMAPGETKRPALTRNAYLLKRPLNKIPKINKPFFRFNAHGELLNRTHLLNLFAIAEANPKTRFTLWTKQVGVVQSVVKEVPKPRNLHLIRSTLKVNDPSPVVPTGFDKVFTVYTPEYAEKHKIKINCGGKSCASCMLCYDNRFNRTKVINELVK